MDGVARSTARTVVNTGAQLLHQGFFRRADQAPDAVAVSGPTDRLTYRELRRRVGDVAGALTVAGVHAGDRVAVLGPQDSDAVVAALAILTVGAVYVPTGGEGSADALDRAGVRMALFAGVEPPSWLPALTVAEALRVGARAGDLAPVTCAVDSPALTDAAGVTVITHAAACDAVGQLGGRLTPGPLEIGSRPIGEPLVYTVLAACAAGVEIVVAHDVQRRDPDQLPGAWAQMSGQACSRRRVGTSALDTAATS